MRKDLYGEMYKLEEVYWWHVAKRRLVREMLSGRLSGFGRKVYVDCGCGTGKMLEEMGKWKKWKKVIGLDGADEALRFCRKRRIKNVMKADFEKRLPLEDESVDLITSLDVVEHIRSDQALLDEFWRIAKPGGLVVITVPAYQWLWTYWDDILKHKRRYRRGGLAEQLRKSGFKVERISYFYSYLLPMAVLFRIVKSLGPNLKRSSDFVALPSWANQLLLALSSAETKVVSRYSIPTGVSVVTVARKK